MSESNAEKIRDNWNKNAENDFGNQAIARVNYAIDEAMRIEFIQKGRNRRKVEKVYKEEFKVDLDSSTQND